MSTGYDTNFALEKRLKELNPTLHQLFTNAVFGLQYILSNYKRVFPQFTDHSELHALNVIEFCNMLIGDQIEKLNEDEIYVLLMSAYLHDCGMGVFEKDYEEFTPKLPSDADSSNDSQLSREEMIRKYHNEYSGFFIQKYVDFFEIPSAEYVTAIVQVARGHRKIDLLNEKEYSLNFGVPSGNKVCLAYLASLIRLADEIDVSASRNSTLLYDMSSITGENHIAEFSKHNAVKQVVVEKEEFQLFIDTNDENIYKKIEVMRDKMQKTLDDCRRATNNRTPYTITQERVVLKPVI